MKKQIKNQNITKKDLEKNLEQMSQTIIEAVNYGFKENEKEHLRIEGKIDKVYNKIDKFLLMFTKREQENKIILAELKVIKNVLKEKLGVDVDSLIFTGK